MPSIDIKPSVLDLSLYAGDGVEFRLICTDSNQNPLDVRGAVEAQIKVDRASGNTPITSFTADLTDAANGVIALSMPGDQTQLLIDDPSSKSGKFTGVWDVQWTPTNGEPRTLCQGKVECVADVTR
jgi:hypothetical protein